jgi:hypothetical protein
MYLGSGASLESLHREIILRLGTAIGNLRLIAVGAPFAAELVKLAEQEVEAALAAAREAEAARRRVSSAIGGTEGGAC